MHPHEQAAAELRNVAPYLDVLAEQLDGSVQDTEEGVMNVIKIVDSVFRCPAAVAAHTGLGSERGPSCLKVVREKLQVDQQLGCHSGNVRPGPGAGY